MQYFHTYPGQERRFCPGTISIFAFPEASCFMTQVSLKLSRKPTRYQWGTG